jgi:hypothetical protein
MFAQRRRHIGASWHYTLQSQFLLAFTGIVDIFLPASIVVLIINPMDVRQVPWGEVVYILFTGYSIMLFKQVSIAQVFKSLSEITKQVPMWMALGGFELLHWAFTIALALSLPFKKKSW